MARTGNSNSKISIWWDIENCHVPRNVDSHCIAQNLRSALHHANLNGPITIDVFGDTRNLDHKTLEALSSTGVTINHIPSGNKDAADKAILVGMLFWALDNAPPAHFLLISGDGDFANALHRLRFKGYNILLARPDQPVKPALLGAATSVWYWTNVAKGQIPAPEDNSSSRFVVMEQNPSNGILSSPSRVSKDTNTITASAYPQSGAQGSSLYHRQTNLSILETLRFWLMEISQTQPDYDVSLVPKDFQQATGIQLEIQKLGFPRLQDLIEHFHDVVTIKVARKGLKVLCPAAKVNCISASCKDTPQRGQGPPSIVPTPGNTGASEDFLVKAAAQNHPILKKLRKWLLRMPDLKDGYDLSLIKKEFLEDTGIVLDPPSLGYSKIKDIINVFPQDFRVESPRHGLSLVFATKKGMPAVKSMPECKARPPCKTK